MMGHLAVPGLGDGQTPASMLPEAYGLARETLQYDGPIYTDDIGGMKAIADSLPLADAVVTSLNAGADMPLWSTEGDINAVIDAVSVPWTRGACRASVSRTRPAMSAFHRPTLQPRPHRTRKNTTKTVNL